MLRVRTKWKAESVRGNCQPHPPKERQISKSTKPGESSTVGFVLILCPDATAPTSPFVWEKFLLLRSPKDAPPTPTPGLPYLWLSTCNFALEFAATFSDHVKENWLTLSLQTCFPWHVCGCFPMLKLDGFQECPASDGSSLHCVRMAYCFQIYLILIDWDFPWLFSHLELNQAASIPVLWTSRSSPCVWWFPHPGIFNWPSNSWLQESKGHHHC